MNKNKDPNGISRRKFLQGIGTGLVGTYVITPASKVLPETLQKGADDDSANKIPLSLKVNSKKIKTKIYPNTTLAGLLRDQLKLTGTKIVCNAGTCGSCTVVLNGKAVYSCHMLALDADNGEVLTIEGLLDGEKLHSIQQAFVDKDGYQCGFCTPGQIMSAYGLLKENPSPTKREIIEGMEGNICRCGAYPSIIEAVEEAARKIIR